MQGELGIGQKMNRQELEASWLTTFGHLEAARAMLPSHPQEDREEGTRVSEFDEWVAYN